MHTLIHTASHADRTVRIDIVFMKYNCNTSLLFSGSATEGCVSHWFAVSFEFSWGTLIHFGQYITAILQIKISSVASILSCRKGAPSASEEREVQRPSANFALGQPRHNLQ